jgi:hypothetical protein
MKSLYLLIFVLFLFAGCKQKDNTITIEFKGAVSEHKWAIKDINPELPSDWSAYEYLTMEFKASSTQRFDLRLFDYGGMRRIRIHPFQNAWVRASIPLFRFKAINTQGTTMSSTYQAGLPTCWTNFHQGPFGSISNIDSIGIGMNLPIGTPSLEFRNVRLTMEPEDSLLSPIPVVDEFGQWIPEEYEGKVKNLDELKAAWAEEEASLGTGNFNYSKFGGYLNKKVKATGYFRVENIDDKWWFVDPEGYVFYSAGSTGIGPRAELSRLQGREYMYAKLPPAGQQNAVQNQQRPAERPVDRPAGMQQAQRRPSGSFYTTNLTHRFGQDWTQKWIDLTVKRMDSWGLNTIANWSDAAFCSSQRKPYVLNIGGWGTNSRTMGMPDVYEPGYKALVEESAARQCAQRKNDPFLIGYFIGNEPIWPGREQELIKIILEGDATPMQAELKRFLAEGDTPERRVEFVYETYKKFVGAVNTAIKKHDPNHLNLGLRFGGDAHAGIITASKGSFDVFSLNVYGYSIKTELLQRIYELSELPIVIGEFHFGTPGRGLAPGLAQVANQNERGVAYSYYVENVAAHPAVIGTHWFQWLDQPNTGRNDGENYNIGFVDVADRPYKDFIAGVKATHMRLFDIHSGNVPPVTQQALRQ